jgi:hypothetical protein
VRAMTWVSGHCWPALVGWVVLYELIYIWQGILGDEWRVDRFAGYDAVDLFE